jgi:hypothetical protein
MRLVVRRMFSIIIVALISALAMEILLNAYAHFHEGKTILFRSVRPYETRAVAGHPLQTDTRVKLSPFYGFGLRPGWSLAQEGDLEAHQHAMGITNRPAYWDWPVNNYGFQSDVDYPFIGSINTIYVAVMGGSVANGLALETTEMIKDAVHSVPALAQHEVKIINLAQGGFKQPQQTIALLYFVSLGQPIDLVISMDGAADAYIGWHNSKYFDVEPALPSVQFIYGLFNNFVSAHRNGVDVLADRISAERFRRVMQTTWSASRYYYAKMRLSWLDDSEKALEREIGTPVADRVYPMMIQKRRFESNESLAIAITDTWFRGSLLAKSIADNIGAAYIHTLHPNQYVGVRKFSAAEAKTAFSSPPWEGASFVPVVYQKMLAKGDALRSRNIRFVDLTAVFDGEDGPFYIDNCCHFSTGGYELIMKKQLSSAIGEALRGRISSAPH